MLNNVKDLGANGDGVSDDRVAIQTAINEAVAHQKAGIWFPAGTYRVSRATGAGDKWSLDLNSVQDFMVMDERPKSVSSGSMAHRAKRSTSKKAVTIPILFGLQNRMARTRSFVLVEG